MTSSLASKLEASGASVELPLSSLTGLRARRRGTQRSRLRIPPDSHSSPSEAFVTEPPNNSDFVRAWLDSRVAAAPAAEVPRAILESLDAVSKINETTLLDELRKLPKRAREA